MIAEQRVMERLEVYQKLLEQSEKDYMKYRDEDAIEDLKVYRKTVGILRWILKGA